MIEAEKVGAEGSGSQEGRGTARALPGLSAWRTLQFGIRAAWEALGLVCAASLTLFAALTLPFILLWCVRVERQNGSSALAWLFAAGSFLLILLIVPPLYGGLCWLVHRVLTHDEPAYTDLWRGAARLYGRAVALGAIQIGVTGILTANLLFYLSRGRFGFLLLAVGFFYLLLFWFMNALYHWPLLIACEADLLRREDSSKSGLSAVFRNGLVLTVSAPGYTFLLLFVLVLLAVPLLLSGVGCALVLPGLKAFLMTQATRDQLVRFGILPAPPDPDEDVADDVWKL